MSFPRQENLEERLDAWGVWCHDRGLKAELQRDLYAASMLITKLAPVVEAAMLSRNYGPDSTDQDWDDFWRGLEKALAKLEAYALQPPDAATLQPVVKRAQDKARRSKMT